MPDTLTLTPPAKLNLNLNIIGRRADGYHQLQSLFAPIDLCDALTLSTSTSASQRVELSMSWSEHLTPFFANKPGFNAHDNLVCKAARAVIKFAEESKRPSLFIKNKSGVHIHLYKNIPAGAGMGGGSSDAAGVILGLNKLWNLGMSEQEMISLAYPLGADCAFFIKGKPAIAEGIGEKLTPISPLSHSYLVVWPSVCVPTAQIFTHPDLTRNAPEQTIAALSQGEYRNDCEAVVRRIFPQVNRAFEWLSQYGKPMLTGTGSAVFLRFNLESHQDACKIHRQLPDDLIGFTAKALASSPVTHQVLH